MSLGGWGSAGVEGELASGEQKKAGSIEVLSLLPQVLTALPSLLVFRSYLQRWTGEIPGTAEEKHETRAFTSYQGHFAAGRKLRQEKQGKLSHVLNQDGPGTLAFRSAPRTSCRRRAVWPVAAAAAAAMACCFWVRLKGSAASDLILLPQEQPCARPTW